MLRAGSFNGFLRGLGLLVRGSVKDSMFNQAQGFRFEKGFRVRVFQGFRG